jgi:HEAT repeat protein
MLDSKQLKSQGLRFARALHMTIKTAMMFTVDHKSMERPIQQSFQILNNMLKEGGQFTFGFVDNQVMLNNLLTTETSLRQLETEFLKRGITAVTFEPGLTLGRYKKVIGLLGAPTKSIDAAGGILVFLDQNELEGARILPAARNQKKDEHGDTIIETDSEAYILSKQMTDEQGPRDLLDSIDSLLESAWFDPSTRAEVLSDFAARGVDGTGYGVPIEMSSLVVLKDGQAVGPESADAPEGGGSGEPRAGIPAGAPAGAPGGGTEPGFGGPGFGGTSPGFGGIGGTGGGSGSGSGAPGGYAGGAGPGFGGGGSGHGGALTGMGSVPGGGPGTGYPGGGTGGHPGGGNGGGSGLPGLPGLGGHLKGGPWTSNSGSFMELVEASVQRSLLEEKGNPQKSYTSLARILRTTGVDKILDHFPAERRQELTTLAPEQLASEYIEDTALQLAGAKLKSASGQPSQKVLIEEEVVRVLARSLQATHMADRLAQKLAKFIEEFAVPPHVQQKIREELSWSSLNNSKKFARLMEIKHYSAIEFRRLTDLTKEFMTQREIDRASALASHYFEFLDDEGAPIDNAELSRAPELIRNVPLAQVGFAAKTAERLGRALLREDLSEYIHFLAASALTVLSQSIAAFEDFPNVLAIGISLETSRDRNTEKHKKCCGLGLDRLLPAAAIERIIELFLVKRNDSGWNKMAARLLRYAAPAGVEGVFKRLNEEPEAKNRLALVRLVGQMGSESIAVAYKYLKDERWYVVRNICVALADLKDPDLADHIVPALEHPDERVQQAALKALVNSRTMGAAPVLSTSLSKLSPKVLDQALDELMFMRQVKTIAGLEEFVSGANAANLAAARKAVHVLACIDDDEALRSLARLFRLEKLDNRIRRAALSVICKNQSSIAVEVLQELATTRGPLADEVRTELKNRVAH